MAATGHSVACVVCFGGSSLATLSRDAAMVRVWRLRICSIVSRFRRLLITFAGLLAGGVALLYGLLLTVSRSPSCRLALMYSLVRCTPVPSRSIARI